MPLRFVVHIPDGPNGSGGRIDGKVILGEMIGDFVEQKRVEIGVVVGGFYDERLMILVENDAAHRRCLRDVAFIHTLDESRHVVVHVGHVDQYLKYIE